MANIIVFYLWTSKVLQKMAPTSTLAPGGSNDSQETIPATEEELERLRAELPKKQACKCLH